MTAVLSATDALRHTRAGAHDDSNYPSSSTDWRSKYLEVADMLAETRAELDDFQQSSKELEEELEQELVRTEKVQQDLKVRAAKAETERDEWKSKFMNLQTTHNTTSTSLQRELDQLRQEYQRIKVELRELEMGNDNLERSERAISSSLVDVETKYTRALEEKILLEHELLDKASVEEQCQRLKDELRDAFEEIIILRNKVTNNTNRSSVVSTADSSKTCSTPSTSTHSSNEDLLHTEPPPNLHLSDLSPSVPPQLPPKLTTRLISFGSSSQTSLLQRTLQPQRSHLSTPPSVSNSSLNRSTTLPNLISTPNRRFQSPMPRSMVARKSPTAIPSENVTAVPVTASKNKGVQMVSEMRARVKNLEQRIHTRVPRLRMGSVSRPVVPSTKTPAASSPIIYSSPQASPHLSDDLGSTIRSKKRPEPAADTKRTSRDTSGWVLIMEDSPSPSKDKEKELRRTSSPSAPSAFRLPQPVFSSPPPAGGKNRSSSALGQSVAQSGIRRPQSRLSDGRTSTSTTASTVSSIPTSVSRPSTPTFLPVPSANLPTSSKDGKRSTGPGLQVKRSSLGSSSPPLPLSPGANVTIRSRIPGPNALGKSRIGKPSGRRSADSDSLAVGSMNSFNDLGRLRSGSASAF